ncbi:unnamed protein product [Clavelina lepadiformis]|uniref:Nose resistant-to-fluoxetine protein N-terminal domain-containing protein n=1 Tax=Clavelina lepadiformis TaxID=159417 RepID=A0ABP0FAW3_CLALP
MKMRLGCIIGLLFFFCYETSSYQPVDYSYNGKAMYNGETFRYNHIENYDRLTNFLQRLNRRNEDFPDILEALSKSIESSNNDEFERTDDVSNLKTCRLQWSKFLRDLQHQPYAWQMADSWGRKESGILDGNVRLYGNYYECIQAKGSTFDGKWCQAFLGYRYEPDVIGIPIDASVGVCFPSGCSESSITRILREILIDRRRNETYIPPLLKVNCPVSTEKQAWTSADTVGVVISAILLALNFIGTCVDLVKRYMKPNVGNVPESVNNDNQNSCTSKHPRLLERIALCFSIISNGEKILSMKPPRGALKNLDGIRFLSTTWIILGHVFMFAMYQIDNPVSTGRYLKSKADFMPIFNFTFSVDTFFLLGGLLVCYLGMKQLVKSKGRMNIPLMYLHRYIRLTPVYAYLILFSVGLYKWMASGPQWYGNAMSYYNNCKTYWWTNLIYINELYPASNPCFGWCWYLAVDMQFYLLSPFILLLLFWWRRVGITLMFLLTLASMSVCSALSSEGAIQPTVIYHAQQFSIYYRFYFSTKSEVTYEYKFKYDIYYMPWVRLHVYMIGMITGYILFVTKGKLKMPKLVVVSGWLISTGSSLAIMYALYPQTSVGANLATGWAVTYNTFARPAFGVCVSWVIVACISGYGGPVTKFLNWKVFVPLSRLTYSTYVVHFLVLDWYKYYQDEMIHFQTVNLVYAYIGTLCISLSLAFILSVTIEWPFIELAKVLLPSKRGNLSTKPNNVIEENQRKGDHALSVVPGEIPAPHDVAQEKIITEGCANGNSNVEDVCQNLGYIGESISSLSAENNQSKL